MPEPERRTPLVGQVGEEVQPLLDDLVKKGIARRIHPPIVYSHDELDRQVDTDKPVSREE